MKKIYYQLTLVIFALSGPLWGMDVLQDPVYTAAGEGDLEKVVRLVTGGAKIIPEALIIACRCENEMHPSFIGQQRIRIFFNWWLAQNDTLKRLFQPQAQDAPCLTKTLLELIRQNKSDEEITRAITRA